MSKFNADYKYLLLFAIHHSLPMKILFTLATISLLFFNSCTVQKRIYNKGFSINWKNSYGKEIDKKSYNTKKYNRIDTEETDTLITYSNLNTIEIQESQSSLTLQSDSIDVPKCDLMILKNGDEVWVNVIEIDPENIKYKKCDNPDGPIYFIRKSTVFMIKYKNGTKDVFSEASSFKGNNEPVEKTSPAETQVTSNEENSAFFGIASIILAIVALFTPISLSLMLLVVAFLFGIAGAFGKNAIPAIIGMALSILLIIITLATMNNI